MILVVQNGTTGVNGHHAVKRAVKDNKIRAQTNVCPGISEYVQTRTCRVELLAVPYHPWADLGKCSSTCADGVMVRTAGHICGEMLRRDTTTCGAEGYWQE